MYKFSVYSFSSKEIDQICSLAKSWAIGEVFLPIDARKFTKQVKEYALHWNIIEKKNGRLYVTRGYQFNPRYSLPIEALWRLVQPMLNEDGTAGFAMAKSKLWAQHFGIDPHGSRFASDQDLEAQESILCELASYHYIDFQMAGSVWRITRKERAA